MWDGVRGTSCLLWPWANNFKMYGIPTGKIVYSTRDQKYIYLLVKLAVYGYRVFCIYQRVDTTNGICSSYVLYIHIHSG